jgi:hypothetical protein
MFSPILLFYIYFVALESTLNRIRRKVLIPNNYRLGPYGLKGPKKGLSLLHNI